MMGHKIVLVPVDGTEGTRSAIEVALTIGRDFQAHVVGLHVRADSKDAVPLLGEGMSGAMIEEIIDLAEQESVKRAKRARQMFEETCAKFNVAMVSSPPGPDRETADWIDETGHEDDLVARRGRLADLVVAARPTDSTEPSAALTRNAALFETGRPVLVAPPQAPKVIGSRIGIFWNGSAQAARAVAAAMPYAEKAESVHVISAETGSTSPSVARDLAWYLSWRGINATTQTVTSPPGSAVGEALLKACANCDLLVMGAYTHSRLRQLILGGVTQHVLQTATIPVLMGH